MSPATSTPKMTPAVNLTVKSQLARLLATEAITVQHSSSAATASFDTNTRVLTLPIWSKASEDLYDMLVAHEVGHALHTPRESVYEPICQRVCPNDPKLFFRYLNIIEDIRIENAIKQAFPGVRRSFYNGYRELLNNDFFGLQSEDIRDLSLADRLNIYAKGGQLGLVDVPFTDEERAIVDRAMAVESFDDVVAIAEEIFTDTGTAKQQPEQSPEGTPMNIGSAGDKVEDGDGEDANGGAPMSQSDDANEIENNQSGSGKQQDKRDEQEQQPQSNAGGKQSEGENEMNDSGTGDDAGANPDATGRKMPSSTGRAKQEIKTDAALSTKIKDLTDAAGKYGADYAYYRMPTLNMDKIVFNINDVHADLGILRNLPKFKFVGDTLFSRIVDRNKNFVLSLVKQFEQKMAADTLLRTKTARTGQLDMRKIANYKFADDIFLRCTTVEKGKNHGMVFIMDWSGSMNEYLLPTIEQLMALCLFCRRMNIPFDVYAFTDTLPCYRKHLGADGRWNGENPYYTGRQEKTFIDIAKEYSFNKVKDTYGCEYTQFSTNGTLNLTSGLIHMLSSDMGNKQFTTAAGNICQLAYCNDASGSDLAGDGADRLTRDYLPDALASCYGLSGTPLNSAILQATHIVNAFKAKHRTEIVNTIFLTDGDATSTVTTRDSNGNVGTSIVTLPNSVQMPIGTRYLGRRNAPKGQYDYLPDYTRETMYAVDIFKALTGANAIGIRLCGQRDGARVAYGYHGGDQKMLDKWQREWRDDSFFSITNLAFTEFFVIRSKSEIINNEDIFDGIADDATPTAIARAFIKGNGKKITSRVLLNRFSDIIAKKVLA